jgi:hypothetical protein
LLAAEQEAQQIVNAARSGNYFIDFFSIVSWAQYTTGGAKSYAVCYMLNVFTSITTSCILIFHFFHCQHYYLVSSFFFQMVINLELE